MIKDWFYGYKCREIRVAGNAGFLRLIGWGIKGLMLGRISNKGLFCGWYIKVDFEMGGGKCEKFFSLMISTEYLKIKDYSIFIKCWDLSGKEYLTINFELHISK